ncbi:recombinase family protein [Butyricicoccus sp. AM78-15b2TA]|uniref:recombinase family protein n=1 Tax=Butyricicoccus sp. AM78-15b2TA TaxID=3002516 RepID=UPI0022E5EC2D|nr:recombinase family protein [Butyricicoccus sp. AM78-15b2TA]
MSIYGYCRISTPQQNIERQERNIKAAYPDAVLVSEAYTGTKIERPKWSRLLARVVKGDTIVFDSVSRMSRDAVDGYAAYEDLYSRGVTLVFLKEPHINTDTYRAAMSVSLPKTDTKVDILLDAVEQFMLALAKEQIQLAFDQSEKEVKDLHQRTSEGIKTAKLNGKQIGQPKGAKLTTKKSIAAKQIIKQHAKEFGGSLSDPEVIKLAGISRNSYYKYKRELTEGEG